MKIRDFFFTVDPQAKIVKARKDHCCDNCMAVIGRLTKYLRCKDTEIGKGKVRYVDHSFCLPCSDEEIYID
jgi:hypothetical protein